MSARECLVHRCGGNPRIVDAYRAEVQAEDRRPSRLFATPAEIDVFLRRHFSEQVVLSYQQAIGDKAVEEAALDARGAIAVRSLDPTRRPLTAKQVADYIDPAQDGGPYPSRLLCSEHDGFGPCPGAPRCTPREDEQAGGESR